MIFARYVDSCGQVFIGEGLNLELAYHDLENMVNIEGDYSAVTFWEAKKLKTKIKITVKIEEFFE